MTELAEVTEQLERRGYAVVPGRLAGPDLDPLVLETVECTTSRHSPCPGCGRHVYRRSMAKRFIESRIWEW
jgi:hypothetical protein